MNGRRTSFQRFGGMVGVQGSALNKWAKGDDTRRDMRNFQTLDPVDMSDRKGIYNLTIKNNKDLEYTPALLSDADMGEEVYGCITSGYIKEVKDPQLEYIAQEAIDNRRKREEYFEEDKDGNSVGKDHFSAVGREWKDWAGHFLTDSVCIPTENIPLVVNSKFEIKYWQEQDEKAEMIEIQKGAGFTSGTLVRPIVFSTKAGEIKDGSLNERAMRSHTLKAVPIKTAHAILNCCKEISLTGSVNYSVERSNKECSGGKMSTYEWEESTPIGCPPGSCEDVSGSITLSCASTKLTTKVLLDGDIEITAYRHKQLTDIWGEEPKTLDISGNYFEGVLGTSIGYMKVSNPTCDPVLDSIPVKLPIPQIEQIAGFAIAKSLTSGCLVYPSTNSSMLHATLGDNLKKKEISVENCENAVLNYGLETSYKDDVNYYFNSFYSNIFPSGVDQFGSIICPKFASGPSLLANFLGTGWDFSGVGTDGPEDAYSKDCNDGTETTNFYNYKGKWNRTGITRTIENGECPLGISGLDRYDSDEEPVGNCKCDDACEDCKKNYGEVRLVCDCQPMCAPIPNPGNPCEDGEIKGGCDGTYQIFMEIGKYVGVEVDPQSQYHNVAAIPLSAKMDTKTEDLTIWWNGQFGQPDANGIAFDRGLGLYLNQASAKNSNPPDDSVTKWDNKEVGTLTIVCDKWSVEVPLWGQFGIAKETTCKGVASGTNVYTTSKDAGNNYCVGCDEEKEGCGSNCTCCGGQCGGSSGISDGCCNSEPCGIDDPCSYAVMARTSGNFYKCQSPDCGGTCKENTQTPCNICCDYCGYDDDECDSVCPEFITCEPMKIISEFSEMGCYGDAYEEDKHEAKVNLTLEFKLFTETE